MRSILKVFLVLLFVGPCFGTSIIFPTYSTPILERGHLIALSPDRLRVFSVSTSGHIEWQMKLPEQGRLYHHKSGDIVLSMGAAVSLLEPEQGKLQTLFEAPPGVDRVEYDEDSDTYLGYSRWEEAELWIFEGDTHVLKGKEKSAESVPYSDKEILVVVKAEREKTASGYRFVRAWMEVFDKVSWKRLWTAPFTGRGDPFHQMCRVGTFLVWEDGSDLVAARISDGQLNRAPAIKPKDALGPSGLRADGDTLLYLASELNFNDFNRSKQTIYRVTLPEFQVKESHVVEVIEAAFLEQAGEYMISDALYRTACFRRDGSKVWEHFQMHRTKVLDGRIYFSDFDNGLARLCFLEVATGTERVLVSEEVDEKKPNKRSEGTPEKSLSSNPSQVPGAPHF